MQGIFFDTNIFLRHLLNDDPVKSRACRQLFDSIERREVEGWTSALVIAEIVFILSNPKTYGISRSDIRSGLVPLIELPGLFIERKRLFSRIFDLYVSFPIDYIDAYHAALIDYYEQRVLFSYDTDFDLLDGITRREPPAPN